MSADTEPATFLDTNILVYAYDRSAGEKQTLAAQLVATLWENENGCLSIQVLQEFYVTVTRKISTPLDAGTARQIVADLSNWRLHTPQASDLLQAIDLQQSHQIAFWDAMVLQSALSLGCIRLYTEDFNHKQKFGDLQVINPFRE